MQNLEEKKNKAIDLVKSGNPYANYFFRNIPNPLSWFYFLKNKDMFSPSQAYMTVQSNDNYYSYRWPALFYLEKVAILNKETEDANIANELLRIIDDVQGYYFKQSLTADNSFAWVYFLRILINIPIETILDFAENNNIDNIAESWIKKWLEKEHTDSVVCVECTIKLLPHFLKGNNRGYVIAESILNLITRIQWDSKKGKEVPILMVRDYYLTTTFRNHLDSIVRKCSVKVIFQLADKLFEMKERHDESASSDKRSYWWLPQIDKEPEGYSIHNEPFKILGVFLRDFVIKTCEIDKNKGKEIVAKFIHKDCQSEFLRRLGLFLISRNWSDYNEYLNDFLGIINDPFENSSYEEELLYLFSNHANAILSLSYFKTIKEKLNLSLKKIKEENETYYPYFQQKWSHPFKDSDDEFFSKIYQESCAVLNQEEISAINQKRARPIVQSGWHKSENVWQAKDILNKPIVDFINHIKDLSQPKKGTLEWIELNDQLQELTRAIADSPDVFINDLSKFSLLESELPGYVLWGFNDALNQKNLFPWDKVLKFCENYLIELEKIIFNKDIHHRFFESFSRLIEDASRKDCFEESQYELIKKLFKKAFQIYPYNTPKDDGDRLTTTINTAYGRLCMSMFSFALHCARMLKQDSNPERISWFKDAYNELLDDKKMLEAYMIFGRYLANFCYINQTWAHSKIDDFKKLDDQTWQWWMEGYLQSSKVYNDLYEKTRYHYERSIKNLKDQKENKQIKDRLAQHLGVGYLRLDEKLTEKNSLFKALLDTHDFDVYQEIIDFFWSHHKRVEEYYREGKPDEDVERVITRICAFAQWITDKEKIKIEDIFKENYPILLSDLSRLVLFIDRLDDQNIKWVLKSSLYVHENHHGYFFWQYLKHFTNNNQNAENLEKILQKSLEKLEYLTNEDEKYIREIVNFVKNNKLPVKDICNALAKRGYAEFALSLMNSDE